MKTDTVPSPARELYTLHIKTDGAMWVVTCDQEPGCFLGGKSLTPLLADFEKAVATLQRLDKREPPK